MRIFQRPSQTAMLRAAAPAGLTALLMLGGALPAAADAITDFYKGKQVNVIIGYGVGG